MREWVYARSLADCIEDLNPPPPTAGAGDYGAPHRRMSRAFAGSKMRRAAQTQRRRRAFWEDAGGTNGIQWTTQIVVLTPTINVHGLRDLAPPG
jgi:hypothetical protein